MLDLHLDLEDKKPVFQQLVDAVVDAINGNHLQQNEWLPTIGCICERFDLSRVTVERAYRHLRKEGRISYVAGKGFYVSGKKPSELRVLLVFNKLSSFKMMVYESIVENLGDCVRTDLQLHHYDPSILRKILEETRDHYDYYVIMPHFYAHADKREALKALGQIPSQSLILLDKYLPQLSNCSMAVYQDFENDIFEALESAQHLICKYRRLAMVFANHAHHPTEIITGARRFCLKHNIGLSVLEMVEHEVLSSGTLYVVTDESDLAVLVKKVRNSSFELGKEIGIISFNETVLKELLDITVISTDFRLMGERVASLLLNPISARLKNPFSMIRRKSL